MAEAVDLAKLHGPEAVEQALRVAADAGRFDEGALAAILAPSPVAVGAGDRVPRARGVVAAALHARLGGLWRMTLTTPAPPPLPDELERLARRLRLPYLRKAAPEVLATARAQRWDPAEVVRVLLVEEAAGRDTATIRMRRRASGLPAGKTFDVWDQAASAVPAATQHSLRTLEWLGRAENLCLCGPSGAGKSHLVEALGHLAIDHGKTVAWHTLESLTALVRRHRPDDTVSKAIGRLIRADLIVIDDVGMLPVSLEAAEALFRVVDAAYERRSLAITSNLHPSGFDELMPKTLAAATVDRLPAPRARPGLRRRRVLPPRPSHPRPRRHPPHHDRLSEFRSHCSLAYGSLPARPELARHWGISMAASGEFRWPPAGNLNGRPWGETDGH